MADKLKFAKPVTIWNRLATSEMGQILDTGTLPGCPTRISASLLSPGVSMQFLAGMSFSVGSTLGPILSWTEGSCNPDVPTPPLTWVIVSFHDAQPPIFISLGEGKKAVFKVVGQSGAWRITTETPFQGWVRVLYPLGLEGRATRSAGDLGKLVDEIKPDLPIWTATAAQLKKTSIKSDDLGLDVTFQFSGPALVPPPVLLAPLGGYPLKLNSNIRRTKDRTAEGVTSWTPDGILKLRFPVRQVPPGRPVALADFNRPMSGSVASIDVPSVVDLALEALRGDRDPQALTMADGAAQDFLEHANGYREPATQQQVFYDAANRGLDVLAAHAFLNAVVSTGSASKPDTALFTTGVWGRDWWTWMPCTDIKQPSDPLNQPLRRAAALLAIAGAMFGTDDARLQGAMFEAGLAAERGRIYLESKPKLLDVLPELREAIFATRLNVASAKQILAPVRVLSNQPVWASVDLDTLVLHFPGPPESDRLLFWMPTDCQITAGANVAILSSERQKETVLIQVIATHKGECTLRVHGLSNSRIVAATRRVGAPDLGRYVERDR
jgi:hypothetical protein